MSLCVVSEVVENAVERGDHDQHQEAIRAQLRFWHFVENATQKLFLSGIDKTGLASLCMNYIQRNQFPSQRVLTA